MHRHWSFLMFGALAAAGLVAVLSLSPAADAPPKKVALVVGVNKYEHDSLKLLHYAVNDATALRYE